MEMQDLAREYESKSDEELLRLELQSADLTPEANVALSAELSRRRINTREQLDEFRVQEQSRKKEEETKAGPLWVLHPYGVGRRRFGKAGYNYSAETGLEQFNTTIFVVLFWIPLIPTRTLRIERRRGWFSRNLTVLEKLPLDWEQVLKVWIVAASSIFAFILAWRLVLNLLMRF